MKKPNKDTLMKKCDDLVKQIVFERDGHCVTCPLWIEIKKNTDKPHEPSSVMQPGHFITRGSKSVRWDLRNVYCQCRVCNMLHEHYPSVMAKYVLDTLGQEEFDKLVFEGNKPMPSIHAWKMQEIFDQLIDVAKVKW